jgi:hypothetical protein
MKTTNSDALERMKAFLANNGAAVCADQLVASLVGLDVEDVNTAIHKSADGLYAALREVKPKLAFAMTTAFVALVHDRIMARLTAQVAKPAPGRSPWRRWELAR